MALSEKMWHPNFVKYMEFIISHPNYGGLAIDYDKEGSPRWIATAKSQTGIQRIEWAKQKAKELGIPIKPGVYAKVMHAIHPTKMKACQICGVSMSINYVYPNASFAKSIRQLFSIDIGIYDSIYSVWDSVISAGYRKLELISLINEKFGTSYTESDSKDVILEECETLCRLGGKAHLGPGAMSNFPDRYDGFHTYNRCHRSAEDKGRSIENLRSYTRDRRAYEYWSDGNIQAANQFMGSGFFKGSSADHVGPISLGFIHDPRYLRPLGVSDNSIKRDRLSVEIINEVLDIQKKTNIYPMSWYSSLVWNYITANYLNNLDKIAGDYRNLLKQSMSNYMYILGQILNLSGNGSDFLIQSVIQPKKQDFMYSYKFDNLGNIINATERNRTERASGEFARFARIAIGAVHDYNTKANRNLSPKLSEVNDRTLDAIIKEVDMGKYSEAFMLLRKLVEDVQKQLISNLD